MLSVELAGAITVFLLVSLGIFIYPWLLGKRWGGALIGLITLGLAGLYFYFDQGRSSTLVAASFAALWALAPVAISLITRRKRSAS